LLLARTRLLFVDARPVRAGVQIYDGPRPSDRMADAVTACQKGIPMTVSALDRRTALVLIDRQTGTAATRNNRTTPPTGWRTR
jgi:hypothetical protein